MSRKSEKVYNRDLFLVRLAATFNSRIEGSHLSSNLFKNCLLKETEFSGSYVSDCDFSDADLSGVKFKAGGFAKNTIENAIWNQTSFNAMYLADTVFEGIIEDCYFENLCF